MKAYKHILLATDFSKSSEEAALKAVALAGYYNAKLTLLHVVESYADNLSGMGMPSDNEKSIQSIIDNNRVRLERLSQRIEHYGAILLTRISMDSAKEEIIHVANEIKADLIVTGKHNANHSSEIPLSTVDAMIHKAPCDVLVIKPTMRVSS